MYMLYMYNSLSQREQDFNKSSFYNAIGQRSIILVGLMGVGKTTIGKSLARLCQLPFYDTDKEIEDCSQLSIKDLFTIYGESEFRALERRVITRVLSKNRLIVASGGGSFIDDYNRQLIKKSGITVWLKLQPHLLATRLARRDTRPLIIGKDPLQIIEEMKQQRYPIYAESDIEIECNTTNPEGLAYLIIEKIYEYING
ncbi:MAG: shikimate kinase [Alphaproteobacteria bacterium]|nr:shikimate kinase [Alphaproteobacteria bacterium]